MTLSRLDACMWENPESAGSLQQRLIDELTMLPPIVLGNMVCALTSSHCTLSQGASSQQTAHCLKPVYCQ